MSGSGYSAGGGLYGGAFTATPYNQVGYGDWTTIGYSLPTSFQTFCTETTVYNFGTYATIDSQVYWDGGGPRNLTTDLKEVYAIFATQGLAALGLSGTTAVQNETVQAYIWQELGYSAPSGWSTFFTAHAADFSYLDTLASPYASSVYALNLWGDAACTIDKQSQLVLATPVPAAALLGVIGLGLVGWVKRRLA